MARALGPRLVAADMSVAALAGALRAGAALTEAERAEYARRADALLAPHRAPALAQIVAEQVLPALGLRA
jgi:hypothetical protein